MINTTNYSLNNLHKPHQIPLEYDGRGGGGSQQNRVKIHSQKQIIGKNTKPKKIYQF